MRSHAARDLASWQVGRRIVGAALAGAGDADLVSVLGTSLVEAGFDISTIEVACDAVDPERANHYFRWRRTGGTTAGEILAGDLFRSMLDNGEALVRLSNAGDRSAAAMQDGATDAVAVISHLAPDVTLGFFDDVMALFVTDRPGGFGAGDLEQIQEILPVFALALGARLNAAAARVLLQTYLGHHAADALLNGRVGLGEVARIRAIVLYCDLLNFTSMTEDLEARVLIDRLNTFFETLTVPVSRAGGQVAGHVGDAVVMFFPVPDPASEPQLAASAVDAALAGLRALQALNDTRFGDAAPPLRARIGIDVGDVVHGNIGSAGRFSFAIIGTPVNRAARLQALAKELGATVLMTAEFAEAGGVRCSAFGKHALRGLERPVDIVGFRL